MRDKKAFIKLIQDHEAIIYKISRSYASAQNDVKDLYQEIVCQLWKSFGSFSGLSKESTWLYKVALNTSITYRKNQRRSRSFNSQDWELHNQQNAESRWKEEQINYLYDQIHQLNPIEKGIILLFLEGKSHQEMADITGLSVSNIGTKISRIKQTLKNQVNKRENGS